MKRKVCETFLKCEWTPYDLRDAKHIKHNTRAAFLERYEVRKRRKQRCYMILYKIDLYDKKWFEKPAADPERVNITGYVTYQKTLVDDRALNRIVKSTLSKLPSEMSDRISYNLYYYYQPALCVYTKLS